MSPVVLYPDLEDSKLGLGETLAQLNLHLLIFNLSHKKVLLVLIYKAESK
jgi:hypothetical protein